MNRKTSPQATPPAGLLRRWWAERKNPGSSAESPEVDLGYESALPWFSGLEGDGAGTRSEAASAESPLSTTP